MSAVNSISLNKIKCAVNTFGMRAYGDAHTTHRFTFAIAFALHCDCEGDKKRGKIDKECNLL